MQPSIACYAALSKTKRGFLGRSVRSIWGTAKAQYVPVRILYSLTVYATTVLESSYGKSGD
jgi:hypothetical protein